VVGVAVVELGEAQPRHLDRLLEVAFIDVFERNQCGHNLQGGGGRHTLVFVFGEHKIVPRHVVEINSPAEKHFARQNVLQVNNRRRLGRFRRFLAVFGRGRRRRFGLLKAVLIIRAENIARL
jgi:hypothetical protein